MSIREEQCNKVCRILDDVLANRPTERDSLIIAVRKAFESLEQLGNSEPLPSADVEPVRHGRWIFGHTLGHSWMKCSECLVSQSGQTACFSYCPNCGAKMDGE